MPKRESLDVAGFHSYLQGMTSSLIGSRASAPLWKRIIHCGVFFFFISCTQFRNFRPLNIYMCVYTVYAAVFMPRDIDS